VIDPMPVPGSPLPGLSVPDMVEDVQVSVLSLLVSVRVVCPAFAVMAPPGRTVQVVVVAAADEPAPSTAAAARATAPIPVCIAESPS
jgi:hypothetical protein